MTSKVQINLRVPQEVVDRLKAEAEKQHRSVNNLIEVIIDAYFKNSEKT